MNTHSRCADSRAEIMASNAIRAGVSLETAKKLLDTVTTDEAVSILNKTGQTEAVMKKSDGKNSVLSSKQSKWHDRNGSSDFLE